MALNPVGAVITGLLALILVWDSVDPSKGVNSSTRLVPISIPTVLNMPCKWMNADPFSGLFHVSWRETFG